MANFLFEIGLFIVVSTFLDFNNPIILSGVRLLFLVELALAYLLFHFLPDRIKEDAREVWVPQKAAPKGFMDAIFGPGKDGASAPQVTYDKMTVQQYETATSKKLVETLISSKVAPLMFSFVMGVHIMLGLQALRTPAEILGNPLVQKYWLGRSLGDEPDYGAGVKFSDPNPPPPTPAGDDDDNDNNNSTNPHGSSSSADGAVDGDPAPADTRPRGGRRDNDMEEAVFRTWEAAQDPAPLGWFEQLRQERNKDLNYRTAEDGWTLLMVVCGGVQNGPAEVRKLLELGARPDVRDKEGWTALHWAAYHGSAPAVDAVAGAYGKKEQLKEDEQEEAVEGGKGGSGGGAKASAGSGEGEGGPKVPPPRRPAANRLRIGGVDDLASLLTLRDRKGRTSLVVAEERKNEAVVKALVAAAKRSGVSVEELRAVRAQAQQAAEEEEEGEKEEGGEERGEEKDEGNAVLRRRK